VGEPGPSARLTLGVRRGAFLPPRLLAPPPSPLLLPAPPSALSPPESVERAALPGRERLSPSPPADRESVCVYVCVLNVSVGVGLCVCLRVCDRESVKERESVCVCDREK